jgi:hypothetical protein
MAAFGATWLFASGLPKVGNPPFADLHDTSDDVPLLGGAQLGG